MLATSDRSNLTQDFFPNRLHGDLARSGVSLVTGLDQVGAEGILAEIGTLLRQDHGQVRDFLEIGGMGAHAVFSCPIIDWSGCVARILRLVKIGADDKNQSTDVMTINRPDDLDHIANLGLTLAEGKRLLAALQQEIVAEQAKGHAVRRPDCRRCGLACRVKDYRDHRVATLFGQVTVRLPRFRCAGCGASEAGHDWPSHCRSAPELDQIQAQFMGEENEPQDSPPVRPQPPERGQQNTQGAAPNHSADERVQSKSRRRLPINL